MSVPRGRFPQPHGNQLRFDLAIKPARHGRFRAFLAVQRQLKAFGRQAFAEILDGLHTAVEGLGNLGICPSRPRDICLEQDLSATKFLRRALEILEDRLTDTPLFLRQPDDIPLVHGKPPCAWKCPRNCHNHHPQFLALTTH
jgi:hypothetical protein